MPPLFVPLTNMPLIFWLLASNSFRTSAKFWISLHPGIALLIAIVAINLVGDRLRDVLNPRSSR